MTSGLPSFVEHVDELASLFEYNRAALLQTEESGVEWRNGVSIHDVSYASLGGGRIQAYWVVPDGEGPFPGVIFVHPAPGNHSTFLDEAIMLGGLGAASLLIEAPWAQVEAFGQSMADPEQARETFILVVQDLRRAVDWAISRPESDAGRLGYVGHSNGAQVGGILSGVEKRFQAFVLMAGTGSFTDVARLNMPFLEGQALAQYAQVMEPIDPVYYVQHAAPSALFFQFGERDSFYNQNKFVAFAEAGSEPKLVRWYDTDHFFQNDRARVDRLEWLQTQFLQ